MSKTFWAVIAVIVVIFGGILLFKGGKAKAPTSSGAKPTSHLIGTSAAGVTLQEYADYECPFCAQFYPIVKQVREKYQDRVVFQFSNLPLSQIHQNAFAAARAAEAASAQGKFWEMHDLLYENQNAWGQSNKATTLFESYAAQLGLNVAQFKTDSASSKVNNAINADVSAFLKTGNEESTPTFLLDGKKITPSYSVDDFSTLIDAELAKKTK